MIPLWAAIITGLAMSVVWQVYLIFVRNSGRQVERLTWLLWLKEAWGQAGFNLDMAANVHGMNSPEEVSAAFNSVLGAFEGWPGQDEVEVVSNSVIFSLDGEEED